MRLSVDVVAAVRRAGEKKRRARGRTTESRRDKKARAQAGGKNSRRFGICVSEAVQRRRVCAKAADNNALAVTPNVTRYRAGRRGKEKRENEIKMKKRGSRDRTPRAIIYIRSFVSSRITAGAR